MLVDYAVFQEKYFRKEINDVPIGMYDLDSCYKPPIRELRALVRSLMTKSPGKLEVRRGVIPGCTWAPRKRLCMKN